MRRRGYAAEVERIRQDNATPRDRWSVAAGPVVARAAALGLDPPPYGSALPSPEVRRVYRARFGCFSAQCASAGTWFERRLFEAARDPERLVDLATPLLAAALFAFTREERRLTVAALPEALRGPVVRWFERLRGRVLPELATFLATTIPVARRGVAGPLVAAQVIGHAFGGLYPFELPIALGTSAPPRIPDPQSVAALAFLDIHPPGSP